ncbi:MAG: transcriptional repressor LexA [Clostridia bacterium]
MKKLTNPQQQIYNFILTYIEDHAFPPSVREICEAVGLKSTATVHVHLKNLEQKGMILRNPNKQRSIQIISGVSCDSFSTPDVISLIGHVAAGQPILATENIEDSFPIPSLLLHGKTSDEVYMLRVEGESMLDAGIYNGDILVVNHDCTCDDGDIVVARVHGESATVKRLYREPNRIRLQPENPMFEPIYVSYEEVELAGKVIGLMRTM